MYARVGMSSVPPDKQDEFVRLAEQAVAHNQQQPGFKGQLLLVERSTGKFITITLWEEEPVSMDADLQTMHTTAESIASTSFHPEIYEVKVKV